MTEGAIPIVPFWTCIPFVFCILSVAFAPLLIARIWKHHYALVMLGSMIFALGVMAFSVPSDAIWLVYGHAFLEMLDEFFGFLSLVGSLSVISGGIYISGPRCE